MGSPRRSPRSRGGARRRALVRGGSSDEEIYARLADIWRLRDDRYSELRTAGTPKAGQKVEMFHIGG